MLKTSEWEEVYIVKHILKNLDEFALLIIMYTQHDSEVVLSKEVNTDVLMSDELTQRFRFASSELLTVFSENMIKIYKLWHQCFTHLKTAKLHNLHQIMILSKSISIVKNDTDVCEVYTLIKFVNQKEHIVSDRKINILILILIDIYEFLSLSIVNYQYFLKIVNNYSQKIWTILLKCCDNISQKLQKWQLRIELQISVKILTV